MVDKRYYDDHPDFDERDPWAAVECMMGAVILAFVTLAIGAVLLFGQAIDSW